MSRLENFQEVSALYRRHGWRPARALLTTDSLAELNAGAPDAAGAPDFEGVPVKEFEVDALWFTREAQGGREAWELRLVGSTAYALFELFEPDETEEERQEVRREMEARLREYAAPRSEES